jgi:hypothetical protein
MANCGLDGDMVGCRGADKEPCMVELRMVYISLVCHIYFGWELIEDRNSGLRAATG